MTETWYEGWRAEILPVQVEKETKSFVVINGRSRRKDGFKIYRRDWDEVKAILVAMQQRQVDSAKNQLKNATERLIKLEGLKQPS